MSATKKTNPRRRPATEDDVQKARMAGMNDAIEFTSAISCLSVMDIFAPTEEQMRAFHAKYNANVEAILSGEIKYPDVKKTLKDEYDLEVSFT